VLYTLVSVKLGADFSRWYEGTRIGHLLFATHLYPSIRESLRTASYCGRL
jgi:hypothetical protein